MAAQGEAVNGQSSMADRKAEQFSSLQPPLQPWFPKAPVLTPPEGQVIRVSNIEQLFAAATEARRGDTILVADGHYWMPRCLRIRTDRVTLRGESGQRERVILDGARSQDGELLALHACSDVTIADLTVQNVRHNGIKINSDSNVQRVAIYNCILHNIWQRGIKGVKVPPEQRDTMRPKDCRVQYCLFYNDRPKQFSDDPADTPQNFNGNYIGGIDVMFAKGWTIGDNVFLGIQGRTSTARAAVFLWQEAKDCIVERNIIIDCDVGIALGNSSKPAEMPVHATRCVVRNNFVTRAPESGIVADFTRDCQIVHNTIHDPTNRLGRLIRLVHSNDGLLVASNLLSGPPIRDESSGHVTFEQNTAKDMTALFTDAAMGNLQVKTTTGFAGNAVPVSPVERRSRNPPAELAEFFAPPEQYRSDVGNFRSPLVFADGTRVQNPADWPRRREEILSRWHNIMGPWPPLIERPRVEVVNTTRRESITQQQLRIETALAGEMVDALLLVPDGEAPAQKRPAVLVVYYDAETGVGLGAPFRDYGWQLAKRGFVALSIGKPNAHIDFTSTNKPRTEPYLGPVGKPVRVEPLSGLAFAAANAHTVLAQRPEVDPTRIGIVGHSFGAKWAMFASCLYDKFACAVWSDPGIVFDERDRRKQNPSGSVNYWDVWYLGFELGTMADPNNAGPFRKLPTEGQARTGAYKALVEAGHDLVELHALMAPRPFLVSGGTADLPERWPALNHAIAVNKLLGYDHRVALTTRDGHTPTDAANEQVYRFFEWCLGDPK